MQRSFDAILAYESGKASDTTTTALEVRVTPSLPHGVLLAAHHVLLESKLPASGAGRSSSSATGEGRSRRGAKPRRAGGAGATAGVGGEGGAVQWERRRKAAGLLLEQAFRSLRLSLLIVGENGCGDDGDGDGDGSDSFDDTADGDNPEATMKTSRKPRSLVSVNANGHMGIVNVSLHTDTGKQTVCAAPPTGSGGNSALDAADGAATEDDDHGMPKDIDCGNDSSGSLGPVDGSGHRRTDAAQRSAVESQRAVVGAWLLAKETCRFFSTLVAASPLPSQEQEEGGAPGSPDLSAGVSDGGEGADVTGSGSLLTAKDVNAVGETLLETLLSLKHMGCVASAQVRRGSIVCLDDGFTFVRVCICVKRAQLGAECRSCRSPFAVGDKGLFNRNQGSPNGVVACLFPRKFPDSGTRSGKGAGTRKPRRAPFPDRGS